MGWNGKKNGELLELLISHGFDVFVTVDKNLQNQQNLEKYPIPVLTLNVKLLTYQHMSKLLPKLKKKLSQQLPKGSTIISE